MPSTKRPVVLALAAAVLVAALAAHGEEKKRRKIWMSMGNPFVLFVPGHPLLVAGTWESSVLLLKVPELEVVRTLASPSDGRQAILLKSSPDGTRVAGYFSKMTLGIPRGQGVLYVWETATGKTVQTLENASLSFEFHPSEPRLIVWQPKIGITQWAYGDSGATQVGQPIAAVTGITPKESLGWFLVDGNSTDFAEAVRGAVGATGGAGEGMRVATDGRHVLVRGSCKAGGRKADFCILSLEDGSLVGSARVNNNRVIWDAQSESENRKNPDWKEGPTMLPVEDFAAFGDLMTAKKLREERRELITVFAQCRHWGADELLCQSAVTVRMQELPESDDKLTLAAFPRSSVLWGIDAGEETGRFINSADVSADGRWAAVGIDGLDVLLFDTRDTEQKRSLITGSWRQPAVVKRLELP